MALIEVFKRTAPDVKLLADAGQLIAKAGKLLRWTDREAFKKNPAAFGGAKPKTVKGKPAPAESEQGVADPAASDTGEASGTGPAITPEEEAAQREGLLKTAQEMGVAIHGRMTNETIRKKLEAAKALAKE